MLVASVLTFLVLLLQFIEVDENTWTAYEDKLYGDNPASVELLNTLEMQKFGLHGVSSHPLLPRRNVLELKFTNKADEF